MPALEFKGKEFVRNHHLSVPHRPLQPDRKKSVGKPELDSNLIIHGDNLHALKSLLPLYASKVNCIYIDPPYNTGNEGWCYNDNVNSPQMQNWLSQNPVGVEDGLRHDKWCCMMWPRLVLLRELLAEDGVIFISIDDNEQHRLRMMMDGIFGGDNFITNYVWKSRTGKEHTAKNVSSNHEHIICYASNIENSDFSKDIRIKSGGKYTDKKGTYSREQLRQWGTNDRRIDRPTMYYPIIGPNGNKIYPIKENGEEGRWRVSQAKIRILLETKQVDYVYDKKSKKWNVYAKKYDGLETKTAYSSILEVTATSANGTKEIKQIFGDKEFETTKPLELIKHLIYVSNTTEDAIILDSFAGSGTTAHATLALNKKDGGKRKFILVECEDYADSITAERVRRVIKGVPTAQDTSLKKGLGGSFTYCDLGEAIEMDKLLTGDHLPSFEALGTLLFHTATNAVIDTQKIDETTGYLGAAGNCHLWLIYRPDLDFLKSDASALTLDKAKKIAKAKRGTKRHLVFAPATFVSHKTLANANKGKGIPVDYQPLPWSLYRVAVS